MPEMPEGIVRNDEADAMHAALERASGLRMSDNR